MNPSAAGWIKKFGHVIKDKQNHYKNKNHLYHSLLEHGFIYGVHLSSPSFAKAEHIYTEDEVAKINLQDPTYIDEVDKKVEELTDRINGVWTCKACGKTSNRKGNLGWHIETHLEGLSFPCNNGCDKTFRSRNALDTQFIRKHK